MSQMEITHAWCGKEMTPARCVQGVRCGEDAFMLSDPAIHCPADMERFTRTNFGTTGFNAFFSTHTCGPTCKALGLSSGLSSSKLAGQAASKTQQTTTTLLMPIAE